MKSHEDLAKYHINSPHLSDPWNDETLAVGELSRRSGDRWATCCCGSVSATSATTKAKKRHDLTQKVSRKSQVGKAWKDLTSSYLL